MKNPSCIYLILKQSKTFPETFPEFIAAEQDPAEAMAIVKMLNGNDHPVFEAPGHRYFARTVWL